MLQTAWLQRLGWDNPLGETEARQWREFQEELPLLEHIRVLRWLWHGPGGSQLELHDFSDASERAHARAVYLRAQNVDGAVHTSLVMAKTRVAPVKQISLPRLELCATALLVRLARHVRATLNLQEAPTHLWSDSTVTLTWIRDHPSRWKTFVANRVSEIQTSLPDAYWHHVPSQENPADCASRGVPPGGLAAHPLWWNGPLWLTDA